MDARDRRRRRRPLTPLLLACCTRTASGYVPFLPSNSTVQSVTSDGDNLNELTKKAYRWTSPEDSTSDRGLGSGIQYVMSSDFCEKILPKFPEESVAAFLHVTKFVRCQDIMDAIVRGLATWEQNHPTISFSPISDTPECESREPTSADECPWELYIGTADGSEYPQLAAYVLNLHASNVGVPVSDRSVRSPAGDVIPGFNDYRRSIMMFQTHLCWYAPMLPPPALTRRRPSPRATTRPSPAPRPRSALAAGTSTPLSATSSTSSPRRASTCC